LIDVPIELDRIDVSRQAKEGACRGDRPLAGSAGITKILPLIDAHRRPLAFNLTGGRSPLLSAAKGRLPQVHAAFRVLGSVVDAKPLRGE
jgi:hypothetical protein